MIDEPNRSDNDLLKRADRREKRWTDAFGKQIADGTTNEIDLASHYNFSPERLRLFKNGTRLFPQYNTVPELEDKADVWTLKPAGGETLHIESAESTTYVVNYVLQTSWAFQINQELTGNDYVRFGPYNGGDGWVVEHRGDHGPKEVDIIEARNGSEETLASNVETGRPLTDWTRLEIRYNWYGVGNQVLKQTYTLNGEQINSTVGKTSNDGDRGPATGNLNLWQEVHADASTTGLELDAGSMGAITLGKPTTLNRDKPQLVETTITTADVWEPVYAVRIDPSNPNVNVNLTVIDPVSYANNAFVELVAVNMDASKTDASGFSAPSYHHDMNSALQDTYSVSQVPRATDGVQATLGAGEKFGGYTLGSAQITSGGNTTATSGTRSSQTLEKKSILNSDHLVFLARTDTSGGTFRFVWDADQNW